MYCVRLITSFTSLALLAAVGISAANAQGRTAFMQVTGKTSQPIGHHELCSRMPMECGERTASNQPIRLTAALWNELIAVNDNANTAIEPDTDQNIYGREEYWNYPDGLGKGDCEDFALLKRRELMQRGWPAGSLLITVVRQTNGDGHAVLTVRTDRGDLVLDNLEGRIKLWDQTDYQFIKRQSDVDSGRWVSIADDGPALVGSIKR